MNQGTITGGVIKEADDAYTPATAECASQRRVQFAIAATDSKRVRTFWNVEAEGDPTWLDWLKDQARPGTGIKLEYELASRPFVKNKVHVGEVRFLRVIKAEFPPRQTNLNHEDAQSAEEN